MATGKAIKVQLALFCIVFITLSALTESRYEGIGAMTSSNNNVVDNFRVKPYEDKISFCRDGCSKNKPCYCCAFRPDQCWTSLDECNQKCGRDI
ncbi:hypothetical protein C1H46_033603 [Malus baccata]|uniref:Embryo surrounding factor 1 brassicaceae domain-containing protein n=1 Tax=Malus baccata TaxID=106549 RepID=A0A540L2Z3_MALBA|nr:hypothetical protein C1H46_033603 [Malus baccata]